MCKQGQTATIMGSTMTDFFPEVYGNVSLVTWAHAVNNQAYLTKTLADGRIMMIEADISEGIESNSSDKLIPIMAHPPNRESDLSLESFLEQITNQPKSTIRQGVKLDFKSLAALEMSIGIINYYNKETFPLWINADILPGPINSTVKPVNPYRFLELSKKLGNVVLSLGWTTHYGPGMVGKYKDTDIETMLHVINSNNILNEISFPVRAGLAAESLDELLRLLKTVKHSTLTLWSHENDNVNVSKLNNVIKEIGCDRIYIDVPESLRKQLITS
ncbi:unnamed protein product [Callosobruchus maculatus]|nr:unnamed protein product [Callosobruchus maculatus]